MLVCPQGCRIYDATLSPKIYYASNLIPRQRWRDGPRPERRDRMPVRRRPVETAGAATSVWSFGLFGIEALNRIAQGLAPGFSRVWALRPICYNNAI
jgi:hypothetical protein